MHMQKTAQDVLETDDAFWQDALRTPTTRDIKERYYEPIYLNEECKRLSIIRDRACKRDRTDTANPSVSFFSSLLIEPPINSPP